MSSEDADARLRELLGGLEPPGGFDVDGALARVRRRADRRGRLQRVLAVAAAALVVLGVGAAVVAGRGGDGRPSGGVAAPPSTDDLCAAVAGLTGPFEPFVDGVLPDGRTWELARRADGGVEEVELVVGGERVAGLAVPSTPVDAVQLVFGRVGGGSALVVGAAPPGRAVVLRFPDGTRAAFDLTGDGPAWFAGAVPATDPTSVSLLHGDGRSQELPVTAPTLCGSDE